MLNVVLQCVAQNVVLVPNIFWSYCAKCGLSVVLVNIIMLVYCGKCGPPVCSIKCIASTYYMIRPTLLFSKGSTSKKTCILSRGVR